MSNVQNERKRNLKKKPCARYMIRPTKILNDKTADVEYSNFVHKFSEKENRRKTKNYDCMKCSMHEIEMNGKSEWRLWRRQTQ